MTTGAVGAPGMMAPGVDMVTPMAVAIIPTAAATPVVTPVAILVAIIRMGAMVIPMADMGIRLMVMDMHPMARRMRFSPKPRRSPQRSLRNRRLASSRCCKTPLIGAGFFYVGTA